MDNHISTKYYVGVWIHSGYATIDQLLEYKDIDWAMEVQLFAVTKIGITRISGMCKVKTVCDAVVRGSNKVLKELYETMNCAPFTGAQRIDPEAWSWFYLKNHFMEINLYNILNYIN